VDRKAKLMARAEEIVAPPAFEVGINRGTAPRPGVIPYRIRIGVTGHRILPDTAAVASRIDAVIARIRELCPATSCTPLDLAVVSPLAEGADRMVARAVLAQPGATLEVPLPLPKDDYLTDFQSDHSKQEFATLLAQARQIVTFPPAESRNEAYERVGQYVVERCDILIALWNGKDAQGQGGTGDIVTFARQQGTPLFWIQTEFPFHITEELGSGLTLPGFEPLDEFNRLWVDPASLDATVTAEKARLITAGEAAGLPLLPLQQACSWILPFYVRADFLALRYQRWFMRFGAAIFYLAAGAAAVVPAQLLLHDIFDNEFSLVAAAEVVFMLAILGILLLGRRWKLHERWISYRFLAENFRARFFVALAGVGRSRQSSGERLFIEQPSEQWLTRALDEVWVRRPTEAPTPEQVPALRRFLADAWIGDQLSYQLRSGERNERRHRRIANASLAIFGATLVAAVLHLGSGRIGLTVSWWEGTLILLSIGLPALAGALRGIGAQREYMRNADRSRNMALHLHATKRRMERAPDLSYIRHIAEEAQLLMLGENRDWFVVMQFHDVELHV
jgi:hypothetical protein